MKTAWRYVVGKPDGWWPRLRCWLLEHDWEVCDDVCCESAVRWCLRCLTREDMQESWPTSPFMEGWSHTRGVLPIGWQKERQTEQQVSERTINFRANNHQYSP